MNNQLIASQSIHRASEAATQLWALASTQYPFQNGALIQRYSEVAVIDLLTAFATNGRRAMEACGITENIYLKQPRWTWKPTTNNQKVGELREAFNRIVHAQQLDVGFEKLPADVSSVNGGGLVIPYVMAQTDRKELSFIDLFAMAHAWLFQVMPLIQGTEQQAQQGG